VRGFDESHERNAVLAEERAAKAEERAQRATERAERARVWVGEAATADEHERAVRHLMAHEYAAEAQRTAADMLREQAAEDRRR
jgi:hypothetical protein